MTRIHSSPNAPAEVQPAASTATAPAATTTAPSSAPPKEDLTKSFDMSDDDSALIGDTAEPAKEVKTAPVIAKETPKKVEAVKPTVPVTKTEPSGFLDGLQKKVEPVVARDYTGFTEDESKVLRSMSNDAYNYVAPILKERKSQQQVSAQTIFQHPQAYTLHPEFNRVQSVVNYAATEAQAWNDQLMKIKLGETWTPLVGVDPKTGDFIYGAERQPTPQDEEMVRQSMTKCLNEKQNAEVTLQQMPGQFQQIVQQDHKVIQEERARRFEWVRDPKLMDFEIEIEGIGPKKIGDIRNDLINMFPAYQRGTAGVEVAADLLVAVQAMGARLKEALAGQAVAVTLKEEANRVEPSTTQRPKKAAEAKFGVTEFTMDGMPT